MQKIGKLEKNLSTLNNHYHVEEQISSDKHKIIEDANRNLRGFANCTPFLNDRKTTENDNHPKPTIHKLNRIPITSDNKLTIKNIKASIRNKTI